MKRNTEDEENYRKIVRRVLKLSLATQLYCSGVTTAIDVALPIILA